MLLKELCQTKIYFDRAKKYLLWRQTISLEHLQWFDNFGLAFVVVRQLPNTNTKEKI